MKDSIMNVLDCKTLLVDGRRPGDVTAFQISCSVEDEQNQCTVFYTCGGHPRVLTCELEAVSFGTN